MNIVYTNEPNMCEFRMVATGDIFLCKGEGIVYMRIQQVKSASDGIRYNAATVKEGLLTTFKDTDIVNVLDADLVIK